MKRLKFVCIFILSACILCSIFTACGKKSLESPEITSLNDEYKLSWTPVRDARSYTVKVTPVDDGETKEYTSRRAYYSLASLNEGKYIINIKALSGNDGYSDSEWSVDYEFEKDYESGCVYTLINNNTEYEVLRVGSASGEVVLGDTYRKKPVTGIADAAFKGSGRIEKVVIGENVTSIGENAFYNCTKLVEVVIPESVTSIGKSAFHNCNQLQTINLPSGLTVIEPYTFTTCRSLLDIKLPNVTSIGENAFASCSMLYSVSIPDTVTEICDNAFISCRALTYITIGSGVESIGANAFYGCETIAQIDFADDAKLAEIGEEAFRKCTSIEKVELPQSVTDLGDRVFYECSNLSSVELSDALMHVGVNSFNGTKLYEEALEGDGQFVYADDWLVSWKGTSDESVKEKLTEIKPHTLKQGVVGIADSVFYRSDFTAVDLPESVRVIGKFAFANGVNITRVYTYEDDFTQHSDLTLIDEYAFAGCTSLYLLHLNDGLEKVGRYAFYGCENLKNNATAGRSIIPDSVTFVGSGAFNETKLFKESEGVVYAGSWVVGYNATGNSSSTVTLTGLEDLPVQGIGEYAFYNNTSIRSIAVSTSSARNLRYIGSGAFSGCRNLSAITFSSRLESIESYTFYNCSSLFKVTFTPNLKSIGRSAFYGCTNLDEVDLSESQVEYIGSYAFFNCMNVRKIDLGTEIKTIEDRAFYKCISIEQLTIPSSVESIGERAFYQNEALKTVTFGEGVKSIGDYAFYNCGELTSVEIPDSVEEIGSYAFYKCSAVTRLTIGGGVKSIGDYAFAYLSGITELYIPQSVSSIGRYAFMRCSAIKSITLDSENLSLGTFSFYGCTNATVYTNAGGLPGKWHERWNSSFRPVIWGCELSGDGGYVVSLTLGDGTFTNANAVNGINAPLREGYEFVGWSTVADATEGQFTTAELSQLETGTKVYAVWREIND